MNKPSWNDAPEWANYLAQDANGAWAWFEHKPVIMPGDNYWSSSVGGSRLEMVYALDDSWYDALEQRPQP